MLPGFREDEKVEELRELYLTLLMNSLTMWLWGAKDGALVKPFEREHWRDRVVRASRRRVKAILRGRQAVVEHDPREERLDGRDWPTMAYTMIGLKRMLNLKQCTEDVIRRGVPGDLIETGVWRGGATIFMRGILRAYGVADRRVWVADSFAGLPTPDSEKYPADTGDPHHTFAALAVSIEEVKSNFERFGLLDDQVRFLKGWFNETLPSAPIDRLSVIRLDGDMYGSTMDALINLYPKLSVGGYVIVDDFALTPCKQAVEDFRTAHGIDEPIQKIDWTGAFWRKQQ